MTRLLFVRHGETDFNIAQRICTHTDLAKLSPRGIEQATDLARRLGTVQMAAIYSSPLGRAMQTAAVIAEAFSLPVIRCEGLRELSAGELDGRSDPVAYNELNAALDAWCNGDDTIRIAASGDVGSDVIKRLAEVISAVAPRHTGQTVLLVSHGGLLQMSLPWICANLRPDYGLGRHIPNSAVIEVEWADGLACCVAWAGERLGSDLVPVLN